MLGLAGGGRTTAPETLATTNNVLANTLSYVTGVDFGSPNDRYAGPMAKLLYTTKILGVDSSNLGGLNIESELRARMQTTGPQAGRFSDQADFGDFSNGFGQAFALLALARTSGGIPSEAVTFLLAQQCPGGGFRLFYDSGDTCASDSEADPDATGLDDRSARDHRRAGRIERRGPRESRGSSRDKTQAARSAAPVRPSR